MYPSHVTMTGLIQTGYISIVSSKRRVSGGCFPAKWRKSLACTICDSRTSNASRRRWPKSAARWLAVREKELERDKEALGSWLTLRLATRHPAGQSVAVPNVRTKKFKRTNCVSRWNRLTQKNRILVQSRVGIMSDASKRSEKILTGRCQVRKPLLEERCQITCVMTPTKANL